MTDPRFQPTDPRVHGEPATHRKLDSQFLRPRVGHDGVVANEITYDLHKLGWRAFQDLTAVLLQVSLGQSFHAFADSNDGGRDGAFYGHWATPVDAAEVDLPSEIVTAQATVAQCKFSVKADGTLTPSALKSELEKVEDLHSRGLCDAYLLVTNLRVSGKTEAWLTEKLAERGVEHVMALDGRWIAQQISRRAELRRYVPRVYGLGDLGQILDERRLQQARALMSRLGEDLATFVPTGAYKKAADALAQHGFALLLGAPAAGKSTIAATLSIAALDEWGAGVRRVDSASELLAHWNPHEPNQLFWVDDAFGAIRHEEALSDEWSRRMDQIMTAVAGGARLILTSRDYIYRSARPHLKTYAYPLLRELEVVVDVAELTDAERQRILYNHLKAGDQSASTLRAWKPHLQKVAKSNSFQPEVARRLGLRAFTDASKRRGSFTLQGFVDRPVSFLRDVLHQLDANSISAMACVYMAGDELSIPVQLTTEATEALDLFGGERNKVVPALVALQGTFLALSVTAEGLQNWSFRHPTIREAFAAYIAENPNLVKILLRGMTDDELHRQIDCGMKGDGTLVSVPATLFDYVISRSQLATVDRTWNPVSGIPSLLLRRCSDQFLRLWTHANIDELPSLLDFRSYMGAYWQPRLLGRLAQAGAIPEDLRRHAVKKIAQMAIEDFDSDWMNAPIAHLFTEEDRKDLTARVAEETLASVDDEIYRSADGHAAGVSYADRYNRARETVGDYMELFAESPAIVAELEEARDQIDRSIAEHDWEPDDARESLSDRLDMDFDDGGRDPFDDVDAGRA